jgi:ribosomal protein L37AE/L43A
VIRLSDMWSCSLCNRVTVFPVFSGGKWFCHKCAHVFNLKCKICEVD